MPDERDFTVSGARIHATTWGERDDRVALLVHGLTSNSRGWSLVAPALVRAGYYVVAPDLRGRGRSDKPDHGISIPHHAADLRVLIDALGGAPLDLIGHSLGAQVCLYIAAMWPHLVRRLVLIDAGGPFPEDTFRAIRASLSRLGVVYPSLDDYLSAMRVSPIHLWSDFWDEYYRYDALVSPDGSVRSSVPRLVIEEEMRALDFTALDCLAPYVGAPTLVLAATIGLLGGSAGLVLPRKQAEGLVTTIPGSRLVMVEDVNHYTILVDPNVPREIVSFLSAQ